MDGYEPEKYPFQFTVTWGMDVNYKSYNDFWTLSTNDLKYAACFQLKILSIFGLKQRDYDNMLN